MPPEIERLPLVGVHLSGFAAVVSVHNTILSAPLKHVSLTKAVPSLSVARPLHGAPEVIEKPPIGPQELIVVEGTGGCGATCKHPLAINPASANPETANLKSANLGTIPPIHPTPSVCKMINHSANSYALLYRCATNVSRFIVSASCPKEKSVIGKA